ncbi:MAG: hypothetical protein HWD82_05425 [Flavobacteriaceae bacterium]|nr:hypothetical protein [Flavobacteriaceae bacterium]
MKRIITKPHLFFFGLIPIFIIIGLFYKDVPLNVNISFIYYLLNVDFWCYITAAYFGLIGINYLSLNMVKKYPKKGLTITHIILQILCLLPYLFAIFQLDEAGNLSNNSFTNNPNFSGILLIAFFLFIISIIVHLISFFTSLMLKTD